MPLTLEALPAKEVLTETLVPSSIWKFICILLILVNFKNIPLVWHVSIFQNLVDSADSSSSGSLA